ncbi:MAG: methyltransferase domain-containing protein [Chitinophagaceae bacterium]
MPPSDYHQKIIDYYRDTENAYKDSWDLNNSLAIHYGYWDDKVKSFPQSLIRMNEVMMTTAGIKPGDRVLDAGCGVGGSSIFLASMLGCKVTGITLSPRQVELATLNASKKNIQDLVDFKAMDYCNTDFPDASFDVVWGCESICYADDKEKFIKEAFRLLKPGGRLVVADGFVTEFENNENPIIRQWLDGWEVNWLESPERFENFMRQAGFSAIQYRDISKEASHSSRRLYRYYFLGSIYLGWKKINFSKPATEKQKKNIRACKYQYRGMKKGLWQYGLIVGNKPI